MWVEDRFTTNMADNCLDVLDEFEVVCRLIRREPIVRDRSNPARVLDSLKTSSKFQDDVLQLLQRLGNEPDLAQPKATAIPPLLQILAALPLYATRSFLLRVDGDLFEIYVSTISRIAARVSRKTAALRSHFIQFPDRKEVPALQRKFHALGGIPAIVGAIDCTHIAVRSPGGDQAELFRNRKGYFSINVRVTGHADRKIRNIVARWPGNIHDSRI